MRRIVVVLLTVAVFGIFLNCVFAEKVCNKADKEKAEACSATEKAGQDAEKAPEDASAGPLRSAADDAEAQERFKKGAEQQREMLIRMVPMMVRRQLASYEDMKDRFIKQLNRVRKIAEVEKATRTVKEIDKNIEQLNAEYQERYDEIEASYYERFGKDERGFAKAKKWHKNMQDDIKREEQQKAKEAAEAAATAEDAEPVEKAEEE